MVIYIYIDEDATTTAIISYTCVYASEKAGSAYYEWRPSNTNVIHTIHGDWTEENEEAIGYIQNKPKPVVIYHKDEDDTKYWCGVDASTITIEQAYHLALSYMPYLFYQYEDKTKYSCGPVEHDLYLSTLVFSILYRKDANDTSGNNDMIEIYCTAYSVTGPVLRQDAFPAKIFKKTTDE